MAVKTTCDFCGVDAPHSVNVDGVKLDACGGCVETVTLGEAHRKARKLYPDHPRTEQPPQVKWRPVQWR